MAGALCPEALMRRVIADMHLPRDDDRLRPDRNVARTHADAARRLARQRTQTVGRVLPEMDVRIVDPGNGATVRTGEPGELWCAATT